MKIRLAIARPCLRMEPNLKGRRRGSDSPSPNVVETTPRLRAEQTPASDYEPKPCR